MIPIYKAHVPEGSLALLKEVFHSGRLADGEYVREFEQALRSYLGTAHLVTAGDVSSAITLCLFMAGVRPGDQVIASPMACVATNQPVLNLFADVVWCDIDPRTGMLDPTEISRLVGPRTKAVLHCHWGGDVAEIDAINRVAHEHGLKVIEDAGEALGAEYRGRKIGNTGTDYTVFSFHAIRHITTGEGAAVSFAEPGEAEKGQCLKRYGIHRSSFRDALGEIDARSDIPVAGFNSYLTNIAGAIGVEQMKRVADVESKHRDNGRFFDRELSGMPGIELCDRPPHRQSAYWVYTLLAERRDDLLRALRDRDVYASKVHLRNDVYACFGKRARRLPGLEEFAARYLCIPCGGWLTPDDRTQIVSALKRGW